MFFFMYASKLFFFKSGICSHFSASYLLFWLDYICYIKLYLQFVEIHEDF